MKEYLFPGLVLVLLLLSGCPQPPEPNGDGNGDSQQPPQDQQPGLECPDMELTKKEFEQWLTAVSECKALQGRQLARCMDEYLFVCFFNSDISRCHNETDTDEKDMCYRHFANYLEDESLCGNIAMQKSKDICYLDVAVRTRNKYLCELPEGESYKSICIFALDNTPEKCETLTQNTDACYNIVIAWNTE